MSQIKQKFTLLLGLIIGGIFLWLAIRDVELALVAESLRHARHWLVLPFLGSLALFYWLKAIRWSYLLLPTTRISARDLVPAMIIGFAGNNILPIRLGELLRVFVLAKEQRLSRSMVLGTIVLERMFDAMSILVLLTVATYIATVSSPDLATLRRLLIVVVLVTFAVAYGIVLAPAWLANIVSSILRFIPDRLRHPLVERFRHLQSGFGALREKHTLLRIMVNSIAQWLCMALCVHLSIEAFNVDVSSTAAIFVLGLVVAGISLPAAPGFVGTIEYCFVLGLGFFGVSSNEALGIGIFYHTIAFVSVTTAGALFLRRYNTSLYRLRDEATEAKESDN